MVPAIQYRKPPTPIDVRDWRRFERTDRLRHIAARVRADRDGLRREMITSRLTRAEKAYVQFLVAHADNDQLEPERYINAYNKTSPVIVAPRVMNRTPAFALAWSMPILVSFHAEWWDQDIRTRDEAGFEASKAVMTILAGMRSSSHVLGAYDELAQKPVLWTLFRQLAMIAGREIAIRHYASCTRHLPRLAEVVNRLAPRYLSMIVQELAGLFPNAPIGKFLSADANLAAAWTRQRSGKRNGVLDPDLESWLRRRAPEAAYRYYSHGQNGRYEDDEENIRTATPGGRAVRGYLVPFCTELHTQVPLALQVLSADSFEPRSAERLLPMVFDSWPEIPARFLVADKLWDERASYEYLIRNWGIRLVAIRKRDHLDFKREIHWKDHRSTGRVDGTGLVHCRIHGKPCQFEGVQLPNRARLGLGVGEPAPPGKFRYRVVCADGCGRLNIPMSLDWGALASLPSHGFGRPDDYALRVALQAHRNVSEAGFASLEVAHKLLGKDGMELTRFG